MTVDSFIGQRYNFWIRVPEEANLWVGKWGVSTDYEIRYARARTITETRQVFYPVDPPTTTTPLGG